MKNLTDIIKCSTIVSENHLSIFDYCSTGFVRLTCDKNDDKIKYLILSQKKSFLDSNSVLKLIVIFENFISCFFEHYYLLDIRIVVRTLHVSVRIGHKDGGKSSYIVSKKIIFTDFGKKNPHRLI